MRVVGVKGKVLLPLARSLRSLCSNGIKDDSELGIMMSPLARSKRPTPLFRPIARRLGGGQAES